jgi:exodeoxyribonuclease VII small subunit
MTQEDEPVSEKVNRVETIIEQLEAGDLSLEEAEELHAEGQTVLEELQELLDVGDGDVVER